MALKSSIILLCFTFNACAQNNNSSIDTKIAQMLMIGFRGLSIQENPKMQIAIQKHHIGAVVLFDYDMPNKVFQRNIESPEQVQKLCYDLQQLASETLIIAIDQEGGIIRRLKERWGFDSGISHARIGAINHPDSSFNYAMKIAKQLNYCGINLNLAPVVDLNLNSENPIIGKLERSFSNDPKIVTEMAEKYIAAHHQLNIQTCLKHFPGHGSSQSDSHLGMTDISQTWTSIELLPYANLIQKGYNSAIMTAHVFNKTFDTVPATLSRFFIQKLLRDSLGFQGLIISDDMEMKAIKNHYGLEKAILLAINAGVDMLSFSNNGEVYDEDIAEKVIKIIKKLVMEDQISLERINESYERILEFKGRIKL